VVEDVETFDAELNLRHSLILKLRARVASIWVKAGPVAALTPVLPYCNCGALAKAWMLNHSDGVLSGIPE